MSFSEAPVHPFIPQHVFTEHLQRTALDAKLQQETKGVSVFGLLETNVLLP